MSDTIVKTKARYSDEVLAEFKEIILLKLDKARNDYETLKSAITMSDSNDTQDTAPIVDIYRDGAVVLSKSESWELAQRQVKFIQHLESALVRIENKTYGTCRETGKLIAKDRLRVVPHATLSVDAKNNQQ